MENNYESSVNHESKKRKIDEVIIEATGNSCEAVIVKQEEDESIEIIRVDSPSDDFTNDVIDIDIESGELLSSHTVENSTTTGNLTVIPISQLKETYTEHGNDHRVDQALDEIIDWNLLIEKIGQLEGNLAQKMSSEMSALKKSWEENNCKCIFTHKKTMDELTLKIDKLTQENAQQEEQKQLLMKEKTELQQILEKEREFRLQLSGMLNVDIWKPKTETIIKPELNNNESTQNNDEGKLCSPPKIKSENIARQKSHEPHENSPKKDLILEKQKSAFTIPKFLRDTAPKKLSLQNLADEIRERDKRRYNIIMRGMRYTGSNLFDDIADVLWRRTGIIPKIANYVIMDSYLILQMASLGNKYGILSRKHSLKSVHITIHNDLTDREDQVQSWLHNLATDQRKIGNKVEVRFLKIKIDGEWWVWDERMGDLVNNGKKLGLNEL